MPPDANAGPAPPLLAWAAGAALAGAAVLALRVSPYWPAGEPPGPAADLTSLALAEAPRGALQVIGLGTSLLRSATPPTERGVDSVGRPISWARVTRSGSGPSEFSASLTVIARAPPDVLVIEKNLLVAEPEDTGTVRPDLIEVLRHLATGEQRRVAPPVRRARWLQQVQCPPLAAPASAEALAQRQRDLVSGYRRAPDSTLVAPLLRLANGGAHVMILDVPRSPAIEEATAADKQRWFERVRELLPPGPNLSYHTGPSYAQANLYCDARHLTSAGAEQFRQWWWRELGQVRKAVH